MTRKTFTIYRCDRCGKLHYGAPQIEPGDEGPPGPNVDCGCYMGPRWVKGMWTPDPLSSASVFGPGFDEGFPEGVVAPSSRHSQEDS